MSSLPTPLSIEAAAKADLLANFKKLKVEKAWALTVAGTPFALLTWGYTANSQSFELHVHGKERKSGNYKLDSKDTDVKVCQKGGGGNPAYLSSLEFEAIRSGVRDALEGTAKNEDEERKK